MRQSVEELASELSERIAAGEAMADRLADLSQEVGASGGSLYGAALIDMARLHRVSAIVSRARLAGLADWESRHATARLNPFG